MATSSPSAAITLPANSPVLNGYKEPAAPSTVAASPQPSLGGRTATTAEAITLATRTPAPARVNPDTITTPATPTFEDPGRPTKDSTTSANSSRLDQIAQMAQNLTDQINVKYNSKEANDKEVIAGQDARARVLNTRTGATDSGTGSAAIGAVQDKGAKAIAADEAARNAEIGVALGKVDTLKADQAKAFAAQQSNDLKTYNDVKAKNLKTAQESIVSLGKSGVDAASLKTKEPDTYAAIQKETGMSDLEMTAAFNASKPQPTKFQYKVSGDEVTAYGVDSNGKLVTQSQTVPGLSSGTWKIVETTDGRILQQNTTTGEYKGLGAGATKPASTEPGPSKADVSGAITWMRAQPDYQKDYEGQFNSDPVIQAKVIAAWKAATKSKTGSSSSGSNPYATTP